MARIKEDFKIGVADGLGLFDEVGEGSDFSEEAKRNIHENSLKNLRPRKAGNVKPKAFMQLNIYEYEDFIYRMGKITNKTMSAYVLGLIEKDMKEKITLYEELKSVKTLDKPKRIARHTKRGS